MKQLLFVLFLGCLACNSNESLPEYSTISAVKVYTGEGIAASVLIPSVSRELKSDQREKTLREIMKAKGWHIISAYSSIDAYKESSCEPYEKRTKAYKEGFIGKVDEFGKFNE